MLTGSFATLKGLPYFLELYIFLYPSSNQWNTDFRSFLFIVPCHWLERTHSRLV